VANNSTAIKVNLARAASPMLDVFPSIGTAPLELVQYVYVEGCLERIIFRFGPSSFVVVADEDDDTVVLRIASTDSLNMPQEGNVSHLKVWEPFIGKPFGWGSICNQPARLL
jgi:hypothetical protein